MTFGDRDPEKVRAWQRRSQEKARERARERSSGDVRPSTGLSRASSREPAVRRVEPVLGPLTKAEWKRQVWELSGGCCVVTGEEFRLDAGTWVWQAHHLISAQWLKRHGLHHLVYDPRNGVALTKRVHEQHELAVRRIPLSVVPGRAYEFAAEIGPHAVGLLGPPVYPHAADPRTDEEDA